jgi:hypothetical protein
MRRDPRAALPLGCDGRCAACSSESKPKCYRAAVLFPESPAASFRMIGSAQVTLGRDSWIVSDSRALACLIAIFRGVRRTGHSRPIRDRLVATCRSPRRQRVLTNTLVTPPTTHDGDFCALGGVDLSELAAPEWALLVEAIPAFGTHYELAPTAASAWRLLEGTAVLLSTFRDLGADMARGLETRTDVEARRDLAAELRAALVPCKRLRDARRAVEDLREDWMCSPDPGRNRTGTRALAVLLATARLHRSPPRRGGTLGGRTVGGR